MSDAQQQERLSVLEADQAFFEALLAADVDQLASLLADDFHIVDVNEGAVTPRALFIGFVASGAADFKSIDTDSTECIVRLYGDAAVVIGSTIMQFELEAGDMFSDRSRYTHVYVRSASNKWLLASAQGTRINP